MPLSCVVAWQALVTSSEVKEAAAGMFGGAGVETLLAALGRVGEIVTEASSTSTDTSTLQQDGAPDVLGAWAGNVTVGYFGSSLSTGDYNGDGMPDIAIGQYGASPQTLPQVHVSLHGLPGDVLMDVFSYL